MDSFETFTVSFIKQLFRELEDPPQVISYLLRDSVLRLPHSTTAIFIQAVLKVFGVWAVDLATRWNNDFLPEVRKTVEHVLSALQAYVKHDNTEIQERVRSFSFC